MRVYLIAPKPEFNSDNAMELSSIGISKPYAYTAAAGITSIAAWFPDGTEIRLCDEIIEPVDFDDAADLIGISINVSQYEHGLEIAAEFRKRGKQVVLGGAHVSLAPHLFKDKADCLVIGEFESVAPAFMDDLCGDGLKPSYQGGKADLATQPIPRWDLYPNDRAILGVVQTSRGCPFECNFCDVIQYLGRAQRHKPSKNVIAEVQFLYDLGYRDISLSDDNFTVYRSRTKQLLVDLAAWNSAPDRETVQFVTQMSIDIARDDDMLELCNKAGMRQAFVGIESDNQESLKESGKRQNLHIDMVEQVSKIVRAGIGIRGGLMVGFDHDDLSCFERQFQFAQSMPIIGFNVASLAAPFSTPLYDDMLKAGRIVDNDDHSTIVSGSSYTNLIPAQMSRKELAEGRDWLKSAVLAPENVMVRFEHFARVLGAPHLKQAKHADSGRTKPFAELMMLMLRDRGARKVINLVRDLAAERPEISHDLTSMLGGYLNEYAADRGLLKNRPTVASVAAH